MAPVVWGLDLAEIKWSKFKSSYMWNNEYHLRRTKFIVYQCALIFCVISESLGTDVLSDYTSGQRKIQRISNHQVVVHNDDYVGAASYNIWAGVYVAFIFGAAFFFDLIWPERKESKGVRIAWKVCGVLAVCFHLASALWITVITATHRSNVRARNGPDRQEFWWSQYKKSHEAPLVYRHNARAIAAVVFAWLGTCSVIPSCVLLFLSINNVEYGPGPKSKHSRERDAAAGVPGSDPESQLSEKEKSIDEPAPARVHDAQTDQTPGSTAAAEDIPHEGAR